MSVLTANWDNRRSKGLYIVAPVGNGKTVYQGALLVWDGAGNVQPASDAASSPTAFAGVARTGPIVGGGSATAADQNAALGIVEIDRAGDGVYNTPDASPFIGQVMYAIDDNTVTGTAPTGGDVDIKVGTVTEVPAAGQVRIAFTNYVV